jgi:hypothetical protein
MRAPLILKRLSKGQRAHIRRIQRDFHERAFGEELAHVNFDLTEKERHEYLAWMRELAQKNGVPPSPRPFEDLEKEIEEELKRTSDRE